MRIKQRYNFSLSPEARAILDQLSSERGVSSSTLLEQTILKLAEGTVSLADIKKERVIKGVKYVEK